MPLATSGSFNITSAQINDGTITNDDINASAGIVTTKLNLAQGTGIRGLAEDLLYVKTVTITSAQLKNIKATAVEIVPAPGANKIIIPEMVIYDFNYVAPQYTNGGTLTLRWAAGVDVPTTNISQAQIQGAVNVVLPSATVTFLGLDRLALVNNNIVMTHVGASEYATGNGTLTINIKYRIVSV